MCKHHARSTIYEHPNPVTLILLVSVSVSAIGVFLDEPNGSHSNDIGNALNVACPVVRPLVAGSC